MSGGSNFSNLHETNQRIFLHARNKNLLWRYEILSYNQLIPTEHVSQMEDDIFWDLSEIDPVTESTKSLKITNLAISSLPPQLSNPITCKVVDLSNNKISKFPLEFFSQIKGVLILRIASNQLTELPIEGLSQLTKLRVLDLRNNPWSSGFIEKLSAYIRMFQTQVEHLFI